MREHHLAALFWTKSQPRFHRKALFCIEIVFSEAGWYLPLGHLICPCSIEIILGSSLLSGLSLLSNPAGAAAGALQMLSCLGVF